MAETIEFQEIVDLVMANAKLAGETKIEVKKLRVASELPDAIVANKRKFIKKIKNDVDDQKIKYKHKDNEIKICFEEIEY